MTPVKLVLPLARPGRHGLVELERARDLRAHADDELVNVVLEDAREVGRRRHV